MNNSPSRTLKEKILDEKQTNELVTVLTPPSGVLFLYIIFFPVHCRVYLLFSYIFFMELYFVKNVTVHLFII